MVAAATFTGSHKLAVPNFEEDASDPSDHRGIVHPVMEGEYNVL
jgi:hypothetical protein